MSKTLFTKKNTRVFTKPLAITIGEPAGIGPELILKCWQERVKNDLAPFIVLGDPTFFQQRANSMQMDISVKTSTVETAGEDFSHFMPVLPLSDKITGDFGRPTSSDGKLVCEAISSAVELTMTNKTSGIVTAPINKKALYDSGFKHPGHTEFLADLAHEFNSDKKGKKYHPVMMLAGPDLRAIPVTIHIAVNQIAKQLTSDLIIRTAKITHHDLKNRFGINAPRIAVAGLNPHAGENGTMGMEDITIVAPAVEALKAEGINAFGPLPADTLFHARARANYDVVLCMYHDQALIPAKTLAFDDSVNVTLGLPFIRTSPDHGTAYDIAGKGIAKPDSMMAAIKLAQTMIQNSTQHLKGVPQ